MRRENHVSQTFINQRAENAVITSSFRQPHCFGLASEAKAKVGNTPTDLGPQIKFVAKRQNRMTIGLRYRIAMTASSDFALSIRFNYPGVGLCVVLFKPSTMCCVKLTTCCL